MQESLQALSFDPRMAHPQLIWVMQPSARWVNITTLCFKAHIRELKHFVQSAPVAEGELDAPCAQRAAWDWQLLAVPLDYQLPRWRRLPPAPAMQAVLTM